jgi:hypothetical protein
MQSINGDGFGLRREPGEAGPLGGIIHTSGHYYQGDLIHNPDGSREFRPYPDDDPRQPWNRPVGDAGEYGAGFSGCR